MVRTFYSLKHVDINPIHIAFINYSYTKLFIDVSWLQAFQTITMFHSPIGGQLFYIAAVNWWPLEPKIYWACRWS